MMKKKICMGIGTAVIVIFLLIAFGVWFLSKDESAFYYTQIDNSKIEQNDSRGGVIDFRGQMEYLYTLPSYNENGNQKEITFGTSRELKEGAFIRLSVMPVRGVTQWSEVQYDELPVAVQERYKISEE